MSTGKPFDQLPFYRPAGRVTDRVSDRLNDRVGDVAIDHSTDLLSASDVWLVPSNGRVVFDERGNSIWQWPGEGDPFAEHDRLEDMNAADLRIAEPTEIRRSKLPWAHDCERPARTRR